jgi:hypothetical protein
MNFFKTLPTRLPEHAPLLLGLFLLAPLFFFQAVRHSFPLGYAGMFAQMAEQIAAANFALPMEIPYYGPGGIPFVYPPLAHYIFAFAIKLGFPIWAYLRLIPAVLALLAFIPFYFLTKILSGSKTAALVAMLLAASAPSVYYTHVWSAGVVRGLALGLCFAGLLFYLRAIRHFSWRIFALAGIALGLLLTTHLLYVAFAALMGVAFLLSEFKMRRVWISAGILLLALLTAVPWLGLVFSRHGLDSFFAASSSHRNIDFFAMLLQDAGSALGFLGGNLAHLADNWFLAGLALPGLALLLARKKFHLPLILAFVLLMGESSIFLPLPVAMIAGIFVAQVFAWLSAWIDKPARMRIAYIALSILVVMMILSSIISDVSTITRFEPEIDTHSIVMARFVREETNVEQTYLYIGRINEAEWFPYLLERNPVFALWGSEWKGNYTEQLQILIDLRDCQNERNWGCMQALLSEHNADPDLLIGPNRRWLETQIRDTRAWELIYSDERYLVWEKKR